MNNTQPKFIKTKEGSLRLGNVKRGKVDKKEDDSKVILQRGQPLPE